MSPLPHPPSIDQSLSMGDQTTDFDEYGEAIEDAKDLAQALAEQTTVPPKGHDEVLYQQGATTPLFDALEELKWQEALELLEVAPEQASTWVRSTGTANTTFGWAIWKRLPLHEACRRQAPAWLVAALLKVFPESIRSKTHFGELPLHLAVEMQAPPEVVNLLIVNYYGAITVKDNSDRTPLQVLQESDVVNVEDHSYIFESLQSAQDNLMALELNFFKQMETMQAEHSKAVRDLKIQHQKDMEAEYDVKRELNSALVSMEGHVSHYKEERQSLERTLNSHFVEKEGWQKSLENREQTLEELQLCAGEKMKLIAELEQELRQKNKTITELKVRVSLLQEDLVAVATLQRDSIAKTLQQTQDDLQSFTQSHLALQGQLQGQTQGLLLLLQERSITMPPPPKGRDEPEEDEGRMDDVMNAAARAASRAIQSADIQGMEQEMYDELATSMSAQESNGSYEQEEEKKSSDRYAPSF